MFGLLLFAFILVIWALILWMSFEKIDVERMEKTKLELLQYKDLLVMVSKELETMERKYNDLVLICQEMKKRGLIKTPEETK